MFWLGERPSTMDDYTPFIAVRRIKWIEAIIAQDPVLQDAVVHIEEIHIPFAEHRGAQPEKYGKIRLGPDRLPVEFDLAAYRIFGPEVATASQFDYIPKDTEADYYVSCSQNLRDRPEASLLLCVVLANYDADDHIRLKARLYFPPNPIDKPMYFRDVAQRMREVARCLDVTEELVNVQKERPTLAGCI